MAELKVLMSRLKTRRAGGTPGILPELILCGSPNILDRLLVLMLNVRKEGHVPKDRRNALNDLFPRKAIFSTVITGMGSD